LIIEKKKKEKKEKKKEKRTIFTINQQHPTLLIMTVRLTLVGAPSNNWSFMEPQYIKEKRKIMKKMNYCSHQFTL
jgi:hypothetical protein